MRIFATSVAISALLGIWMAAPATAAPGDHDNSGGNQHQADDHAGKHPAVVHTQKTTVTPQTHAVTAVSHGAPQGGASSHDHVATTHTTHDHVATTHTDTHTTTADAHVFRGVTTHGAVNSGNTGNNGNNANNGNNGHDDHRGTANAVNTSHEHQHADVSQYRRNVTSQRHFHAEAYRAPRGYSYHRWGYGERLPEIYYARDYWLTDWAIYDLFGPPEGYVWVRYGPDALLIDEYTGEIVQVRYGVFY